jgi:hypothetical protein
LRLQYGDAAVPWWLGGALAAGGVYAGMRIGAAKLKKENVDAQGAIIPDAAPAAQQVQQAQQSPAPAKSSVMGNVVLTPMTPRGK